jgi:hypothetical protein
MNKLPHLILLFAQQFPATQQTRLNRGVEILVFVNIEQV